MTFWIVWKVTACDFTACRHDIKGICVMRGTLVLMLDAKNINGRDAYWSNQMESRC